MWFLLVVVVVDAVGLALPVLVLVLLVVLLMSLPDLRDPARLESCDVSHHSALVDVQGVLSWRSPCVGGAFA